MRGIGALMPWTRWAFLAGALALVGVPPFSGFFSKDSIIAAALHDHWYGVVLAIAALVGAFLTGLYTFRLYFIVFPGEPSAFVREHHHAHHGKEGPLTMLVPVGILAVLAVIGGWIQFSPFWHPLTTWLEPVGADARRRGADEHAGGDRLRRSPSCSGSPASASRMALYGTRPARRSAAAGGAARARAQALLRRGVRRALLPACRRVRRRGCAATSRSPSSSPPGPTSAKGRSSSAKAFGRLQTGLLRTYVLFLGTGVAIVGVVFLAVR